MSESMSELERNLANAITARKQYEDGEDMAILFDNVINNLQETIKSLNTLDKLDRY
jgi:hypothetical protein